MNVATATPKVFISYSWTSTDRVIELAQRLMQDGVEVVLDKWKLKEGQDKYLFMEQCVTDDSINKVLMVCDKTYAEKANKRKGGVGDETMIISTEVYGKAKQELFPLFGVTQTRNLIEQIKKSENDKAMRYDWSSSPAPSTIHSIKLDKIGTMP